MSSIRRLVDAPPGLSVLELESELEQSLLLAQRGVEHHPDGEAGAARLERQYTKEQILEFYMNSVFFGSNAYGVQAAAQEYWGAEDLDDVTPAQAAAMVTAIRNPTLYDVRDNPSQVIRARNDVLDQMEEEGWLTPREAREARAEPLRRQPQPPARVQPDGDVLLAVEGGEHRFGDSVTDVGDEIQDWLGIGLGGVDDLRVSLGPKRRPFFRVRRTSQRSTAVVAAGLPAARRGQLGGLASSGRILGKHSERERLALEDEQSGKNKS